MTLLSGTLTVLATEEDTMTTTEAQKIAQIRAWQTKAASANTNPPAGFEATCPQCHQPSHKTLVERWGHCMACHRAAWNV